MSALSAVSRGQDASRFGAPYFRGAMISLR